MPGNPVAFSTRVFCLAERVKKMNSIKDDVGIQTIQEIYNSMQVDEEWSIETENGGESLMLFSEAIKIGQLKTAAL